MSKIENFRSLPVIVLITLAVVSIAIYVGSRTSQALAGDGSALGAAQSGAGTLIVDAATGLPAVAPLTMNFVRTPDTTGPDGKGRYLIAVNSGFGLTFSSKSRPQQTLSVIDLNLKPEPKVIQNLYFPSPQSANVGLVFDPKLQPDGKYRLFVAGGNENKIWILGLDMTAAQPLLPQSKPDEKFDSPSVDVSGFAENAPTPNYNGNVAPIYPMGLALSPDGETIYSANNLGDTLGILSDLRNARKIARINLRRPGSEQFVYPYDVKVLANSGRVAKTYVSLWGDGSIAVVSPSNSVSHVKVDRHPTAMILNKAQTRLMVVNSNADVVSVIDTRTDRVIESIKVRLNDSLEIGASPEGLALSEDEKTLYVANAHANAVAVIQLAANPTPKIASKLLGFIPTGKYASAVAVVGNRLFIANGKGTGMENSSNKVTDTGLYPNMPNENYPAGASKRGQYSAAIVAGNISMVDIPDEKQLFAYTQSTMRNNGLLGREKRSIFPGGKSPFKHVIYIIRENRTYDQVFGDLQTAGNGQRADGDASVAIFGAGDAAKSPGGANQSITPNARAIVKRFGLLDRFFVNAEASPDGHNWSTSAFSNDFIDKSFRWNYSGRGRTYDFEGFNRLPSYDPPANQPPVALPTVFSLPATSDDIANFQKKYVPYLNGARDIGEPETLYLWDAAKRAGLTYRNYGEYVATISQEDLAEVNTHKSKKYPDISPTVNAFATKKTLEGNFSPTHRNFDQSTPDSFTTDSYRFARETDASADPAITENNPKSEFRGNSRYGAWSAEFRSYVADQQAGKGDHMPNLSIVRLSNDHTAGLRKGTPTPQFYVAENDYAVGRLVEEVSKSPYWKDTAIFVVEDDAQDGPDHVDAHRSPGLVISAYNRPGVLIHDFHNTVSLIRTLELCLGMRPMNFLDANATPIDIFTDTPNFDPYTAVLPDVALDNLYPADKPVGKTAYYMNMTERQDLRHQDMANPREMNEIIWFSVKGDAAMPVAQRLPAFDLMRAGLKMEAENEGRDHDGDDE
ncbi:MAG: bifunctional YncE family protein/alkaline phosphatase family protein [Pyrinomonadaceae bacterium]